MEKIMLVFNFIMANGAEILTAIIALLSALIAVFSFIPGEQPEKALSKVVAFLSKFSRKK